MRAALARGRFDVLVLDLMLPGGEDGYALCREVRAQQPLLPILMLTARAETVDRVLGLELGADDYVVKPFEPRELVARLRALCRRLRSGQQAAAPVERRFGDWRLDYSQRQLYRPDGVLVPLANAEFRLLATFIERPGRVLSRDFLLDAARGREVEQFDRSIDMLVSRLRSKLGDDARQPRLIRTVRGEGYLFDPPAASG